MEPLLNIVTFENVRYYHGKTVFSKENLMKLSGFRDQCGPGCVKSFKIN